MVLKDKIILYKKRGGIIFNDVTNLITDFREIDDLNYYIKFTDFDGFKTRKDNVKILSKQKQLDINDKLIEYNGSIKNDISKIELYSDNSTSIKYRVYCNNNYTFVCEPSEIIIRDDHYFDDTLIGYWKSCACESDIDTIANMMCDQYDKLILNNDSVLACYIDQTNVKRDVSNEIICPFSFNKSQLSAIKSSLENKISIIKGPPGTGKTQTILNLICNLVVRDKSIAIISSNNTAIENIEKKLKDKGYGSLIASLGNGDRKANFFKTKAEKINNEDIKKVNISIDKLKILSELFQNKNKSKIITDKINAVELEKSYYEKFNNENLTNVDSYKFKNSESLLSYITRYEEDTNERKFTFFLWLKLIFKYGFKKSLIRAKNRDKIITSLEHKYYVLKLQELSRELNEIENLIRDKNLEQLTNEYIEESKHYFDNFISQNINLNKEFDRKNYKKYFNEFIKRYPIITSTALSFMTSIESEYEFDYAIIDESSQVTIPSTIPLLNRCKNIVIVGDDKQLSPIEKFNTKCLFNEVYDCNNYSLMTSFMKIYPKTITTLLEHYRCNPSIIKFCNLKYYNNELIPFKTDGQDNESLILYFTSNENHMKRIYYGDQNGIYNQREIDTIGEILNDEMFSHISHDRIGIISPYRLQVDKLQNIYPDIECDTIHKFQGREKDIIIFSAVLDNKATKNDFAFVDNVNMINVTLSRAIKKFVLVANKDVFEEKGKEIHDLINYISYKSMNENLYKSKCISIFDYLYESKKRERERIIKNSLSKSKYDSEKLLRVLLDKIIKKEPYNQFIIQEQVKIKDLTIDGVTFNEEERAYIENNCSVDFLIKDKVNHDIVCIIEVDGVAYHENNKRQQKKDLLKDSILTKCNISFLRLKTNGSNEETKIKEKFNIYLNKFNP